MPSSKNSPNDRSTPRASWITSSLLLGLLAAAAGALILVSPFGNSLSNFSCDLPFAFDGGLKPQEAVVVYMDEDSRRALGQPADRAWDRRLHARLIRELTARHARVIAFDVLFDSPSPDPGADQELADAMKAHGGVVIAADLHSQLSEGQPGFARVLRASEPLSAVSRWGVDQLPVDTDGVIRELFHEAHFPSLAEVTAMQFLPDFAPASFRTWIGPGVRDGAVPRVSYHQVLTRNALAADLFRDKAVFVGVEPASGLIRETGADLYRTAASRWSGLSVPGVAIHATCFLNLVRKAWLCRLPPWQELVLVVVVGLGVGWLLGRQRPAAAFGLALVAFLLPPVVDLILVTQAHDWFAWAVVSGVQVPIALVGSLAFNASRRPATAAPRVPIEAPAASDHPVIPDHSLLRCIGEGSYGQVWLARNILGTYRAVKIVYRHRFDNQDPFNREFAGIKNFEPHSRTHEGFVDVLHVGRSDEGGFFYCIMELADDIVLGQSINPDTYSPRTLSSEMARHTRMPPAECLRLGLALSAALSRLHEAGLVHRDIKPSNIVYVRGEPKLADIGLVAEAREARSYVGTEGFIPPEGPGTAQADIFSLGKVLYEAAMGMDRKRFPELPDDLGQNPDDETLTDLNAIILRACARTPTRRYRTARRLHEDLVALTPSGRTPNRSRPRS